MQKGACKRPDRVAPAAEKKTKNVNQQKAGSHLKSSKSVENIRVCPSRQPLPRKASTPTHERSITSVSPDISRILSNETKHDVSKRKVKGEKPLTAKVQQKTAVSDETDLQDSLDFEYTRYLQAVFKNKLLRAKASNIDDDLASIQRRITNNERLLHQTSERLKKVNFNNEIDLLYELHNPNFGKVLETLNNTNCEEHLSSLQNKLETRQNQLKVKNIELPQGGGAQLMEVMTETLDALKSLKTDCDVETPKVLSEIKEVNKNTVDLLARCRDLLAPTENILLTRATLDICSRGETYDSSSHL